MKKLNIIIILLIGTMNLNASEYSDWLATQNTSFKTYKKSMDDEFSSMLKKEWKSYSVKKSPKIFKKPKPIILPKVEKVIPVSQKDLERSVKIKTKKIVPLNIKNIKAIQEKLNFKEDYTNLDFKFYNQQILIQYDNKFKYNLYDVNKDSISNAWESLAKSDFKAFIEQIDKYTNRYALNDWAKYLLIHNAGMKIYNNTNQTNIFTWFILTKMHYDSRVAYYKDKIHLLSRVEESLYQNPFFTYDNKKFYILTPKGRANSVGTVYSYPSSYPESKKGLSFSIANKEIAINTNQQTRKLNFTFDKHNYTITAKYSKDLVEFYKTFPQSPHSLYYDSKKSSLLSNSLLMQLKPLVNGKSELKAIANSNNNRNFFKSLIEV